MFDSVSSTMFNSTSTKRFGPKLRQLRRVHRITITQLAARLGYTSHGYISEVETVKKQPTLELAIKVARLFGISLDVLLDDNRNLSPKDTPIVTTLPFIHRPPSNAEIERLRLILSTYQDGTGMMKSSGLYPTLPGWRDFERACALVFSGIAVENKFFVDVLFSSSDSPPTFYGLDCKMKKELKTARSKQTIYVEVTNATKALWSHLNTLNINERTFRNHPSEAGTGLLDAITHLKHSGSAAYPAGPIDLNQSFYLVLLWDQNAKYQLFQLPLALPEPDNLQWSCHITRRNDGTETTRLVGETPAGKLYEWYGESGGQFKYYPPVSSAIWVSDVFQLEPLPETIESGLIAKASAYFPQQWAATE